MRLADEPGFPVLPPGQPTRDLLLAQALDACITAERRLPGSSQEIIARQPAWARGELQRLVGLAGSLDAAASNAVMSSEFRAAARSRLMRQIGGDTSQVSRATTPVAMVRRGTVGLGIAAHAPGKRRFALVTRLTAALVAAVLAIA